MMTEKSQAFARLLDGQVPTDYWYDEMLDKAQETVAAFDDADWADLGTIWQAKSKGWQQLLCESMRGAGERPEALTIYLGLLPAAEIDLRLTIIDSLRSWDLKKIAAAYPDLEKQALLLRGSGAIADLILDDFLKKL